MNYEAKYREIPIPPEYSHIVTFQEIGTVAHVHAVGLEEENARCKETGQVIEACVNACLAVNPDPMKAAEIILRLSKVLNNFALSMVESAISDKYTHVSINGMMDSEDARALIDWEQNFHADRLDKIDSEKISENFYATTGKVIEMNVPLQESDIVDYSTRKPHG